MRALPKLLVSACVAVALIGCDGGRDQLLANLQSLRPEERASAVRKLAEKSRDEDLVLFTRAAKDTAPIVRGEAAAALGKSQDPRVVDLLGDLLGDQDEAVQAAAAMALAQIKTPKAKSYLSLQYARRGRSTRYAIVEGLKSANVPGAMASVVAAESQTLWDRNLKALNEGSPPERVAAAEELGKSGRVEAVNRLLPLIKDSHVILAAAAVRGLGHAGDPRAVEPIAELLKENFPELREAAIESLLRLGDGRAVPRLRAVALEKSSVSGLATQALAGFPEAPELTAVLCELTVIAGPEEASIAARAMRPRGGCPVEPIVERLGKRGEQVAALQALEGLGPTAAPAAAKVVPLLASTDESVRLLALNVVGELRDPAAAEGVRKVYDLELKRLEGLRSKWITAALPKEFSPEFDPAVVNAGTDPGATAKRSQGDLFAKIRASNAAKLKESGKSESARVTPPMELVDDVPEESLRTFAATLRALGAVKAPEAQTLLEGWTNDGSPSVRAAANTGLASLGGDALKRAADGLLDHARDVQGATAHALAEAGDDGQRHVAELLPKLAGDRLPMLLALDRAGPREVTIPALLAVMKEGGAEASLAAQLLGRLKAKDAVEPLMKLLEDPNTMARRDALVALGRIGDARAAELVARELNHDSPDVRAAAVEALAALDANPRPDALDALKGDYYRRVRESAQAAHAPAEDAAAVAEE